MSSLNIFPNKHLQFKSDLEPAEFKKVLEENTYISNIRTGIITNKKFIGKVEEHNFEIISSISRKSIFCVFKGEIISGNVTIVNLNVNLHNGFKLLFIAGFIVFLLILLLTPGTVYQLLYQLFLFLIFSAILGYLYVKFDFDPLSKNGLKELKNLLKLQEIDE